MFRRALPAILAASLGSGCATVPTDTKLPSKEDYVAEHSAQWEALPALQYKHAAVGALLTSDHKLPDSVRSRNIEISTEIGAKLRDVLAALPQMNVPVIVHDEKVQDTPIYIPSYNGPLGGLLDTLSSLTDVSFEWKEGTLVVSPNGHYMISLPQDKDLIRRITEELTALGAQEVKTSLTAGLVSYRATPTLQDRVLEPYIKRSTDNAAMVAMQVAIVTVSLDRERKTGFDWDRLQALVGERGLVGTNSYGSPVQSADGDTNGGTTNGDTGTAVETAADYVKGSLGQLDSGGFAFKVARDSFSLNGFISLLSKYGTTETVQHLMLRTLSGAEVKIRSGQSIPYVSGVSVTTTGNSNVNNAVGGANTETAETGLTLTLNPFYDAASQLATIDLELELKTILSFIELSAGNQIGTFTQPSTQNQSFNDTVRLRVGDTTVLGGLVFESETDNRNTLAGLESLKVGHKSKKVSRNALFIVLRPTATVYGTEPNSHGAR